MGANFMPTLNSGKPFKFWCQKVLPLVYDDSLSYYELLSRVVAYLNNTMENVSELGEAYQQLEDFLNSYLDSHNIEEAVNDRLDEMVEDGTLDDIVSEALDDKFDAYTTATDESIANLRQTVNEHTTRLNNHGTSIYNIEATLATSMVTLPHINATAINADNHFTKDSITAWLRYVTSTYGESLSARPFMGKYTASITMLIIGFAYHFTNLINGLPDYSEFIILAWGGQRLYAFGTNNGVVYFKATDTLTDITEANALSLIGTGDLRMTPVSNNASTDEYRASDNTIDNEVTFVRVEAETTDAEHPETEEAVSETADEIEESEEPVVDHPDTEETDAETADEEIEESEEPVVEHPDTEGEEI